MAGREGLSLGGTNDDSVAVGRHRHRRAGLVPGSFPVDVLAELVEARSTGLRRGRA